MKLCSLFITSLALVTSSGAQYFSEGWQPGQAAVTEAASPPEFTPGADPPSHNEGPRTERQSFGFPSLANILKSGPVSSLFDKIGVNISHQLEVAQARTEYWDPRIPLITDDNYEELIVNESLTPEEEEKRVWFLVITAQAGQTSGISKIVDDSFDAAFNNSLIANDLPNVRWGRIDYLNVTYLTTKWNIWQAPYVVVLKDRGQTLWFYKANQVRLTPELIHDFLELENWSRSEPWKSSFAPGGSNEYLLHYFAIVTRKVYNVMVLLPKWLLMIISGAVASFIMKLMHRNPEAEVAYPEEPEPAPIKLPAAPTPAEKPAAQSPTKSKSGGKSRKTSKK